jgi:preprotein translocase subunit SecF
VHKIRFDIIGRRNWWFLLSALILIPGLISFGMQGFNLGIDFTGGTLLDLRFDNPVTVNQVRDVLKGHNLENSVIQLAGTEKANSSHNAFIRMKVLDEDDRRTLLKDFETALGSFEIQRLEKVGATIGAELTRDAIIAVVLSWVLITAYISYRFEFRFAIAGIITLIHDALLVLGIFSIFQLEIDASFVAALLTVIGYSINDTIVIFDRVRENLKGFKKSDGLVELANKSTWQSMTRSLYTLITALFTVVALYFFGGETIKNFSLALIIGFISGAYSSICIGTPVWVMWREFDERKRVAAKMRGED